jgi:hypothetical protein
MSLRLRGWQSCGVNLGILELMRLGAVVIKINKNINEIESTR